MRTVPAGEPSDSVSLSEIVLLRLQHADPELEFVGELAIVILAILLDRLQDMH